MQLLAIEEASWLSNLSPVLQAVDICTMLGYLYVTVFGYQSICHIIPVTCCSAVCSLNLVEVYDGTHIFLSAPCQE
jgi:hypothetical protein